MWIAQAQENFLKAKIKILEEENESLAEQNKEIEAQLEFSKKQNELLKNDYDDY